MSLCNVCYRDPSNVNNDFRECSHVNCPHRAKAWSTGPPPRRRTNKPKQEPLDEMFDKEIPDETPDV
jgi:hypothetical protein